jgi:hypothetical protein
MDSIGSEHCGYSCLRTAIANPPSRPAIELLPVRGKHARAEILVISLFRRQVAHAWVVPDKRPGRVESRLDCLAIRFRKVARMAPPISDCCSFWTHCSWCSKIPVQHRSVGASCH